MEEVKIGAISKRDRYNELLPQIIHLLKDEPSAIANMANVAAAIKQTFPLISWIGFYLYDKNLNNLVLGPFQGKVACTRIEIGKGVCGFSFKKGNSIIVPDVEKFPGHIYCDGDTKSEIVIPLAHKSGVLDVDSYQLSAFDEIDKECLEQLLTKIEDRIFQTK